MTDLRPPIATDPASIFGDLRVAAERARIRARAEESLESSIEGVENAPAQEQIEVAVRETRGLILQEGADALDKLADDPAATLSPDQQLGLEAIVLLEGRPALPIQGGRFWPPPSEWISLESHRAAIENSIARVGRVEVTGHPDLDWVGTGFLVSPDIVMTNRHVALEFARLDAAGWRFASGRSAGWDLVEELGSTRSMRFEVTEVLGVHDADDVDLALLRVEPAGEGPLPTPLRLAGTAPDQPVGRDVYVIGYPAWDGRRNEPEPMRRIFMDIFNVKRLQPGRTTAFGPANRVLGHDCSTLGGNSGSPVFDLETHTVMGLHFGGRYAVGNNAVPLWQLVDDPLLAGFALNFV